MTILYSSILFFAVHFIVYCAYNFSKKIKFNTNLNLVKTDQSKSSELESNQIFNIPKLANSLEKNNQIILNKSLKHLEFISDFERYLDTKSLENFSLEFLLEFEKIKREAQLVILKTTSQLSTPFNKAA